MLEPKEDGWELLVKVYSFRLSPPLKLPTKTVLLGAVSTESGQEPLLAQPGEDVLASLVSLPMALVDSGPLTGGPTPGPQAMRNSHRCPREPGWHQRCPPDLLDHIWAEKAQLLSLLCVLT